jgi:hypothetical protein
MKKPIIKKAQTGKSVKPTADSTAYFRKQRDMEYADADRAIARSEKDKSPYSSRLYGDYIKSRGIAARKADRNADRQLLKGMSGYDENGYPLNKFKPESPKQQIAKGMKKKMQAGGVVKTTKRVGPVDPDGAWTKVQERNLPPVNAKTKVSLAPDKELGATKMMKKGGEVEKAKGGKWIQKAIKKPGALRAQLGAKKGEPIPAGKLAAAAKKPGKLGQRARLAMTLKGMKKK